MKLKHIKLKSS